MEAEHGKPAFWNGSCMISTELIFVWGMWALSKALPARRTTHAGRVVYYLSDY
jgi:hypothetical protein